MQTFLMCDPRHFDVEYVINPWMEGNKGKVDRLLAARQWQNLHDTLAQRASIKLIEPVAGLPDMVFTANGGFVSPRREVIVSSFRHAERRGESAHFRKFFEDAGYRIVPLGGGIRFEGAGDALFDSSGLVWVGSGIRSDRSAESAIAVTLRADTRGLILVNPRWYHLDTAFCPLPRGAVMAYAKAFSAKSIEIIRQMFGERVVWVSDEDASQFACNAVSVGNDLVLHKASEPLKMTLRGMGFNVIEVDVSEFMKAGGACKCLTLEL